MKRNLFHHPLDQRESGPRGRSRSARCARVSILTPGWCLAVGAVVVAVIGFGDALERLAGGGPDRRVIGRSERPIPTIAFTPDDNQVATLEALGRLTFWKVDGGGRRVITGGDSQRIRCVAFDPRGDAVGLGCFDGSIRFQDWRTGRDSGRIEASGASIQALAFSPNGRCLASGDSNGHLTLWDAKTRKPLLDVDVHQGSVTTLAFSPDGRWLASAGYDGRVIVREAVTGALRASTSCRSGVLGPLLFAPDGGALIWANRFGGFVRRWDLSAGGDILSLECSVQDMTPTPDGRFLLVQIDGERLWQLDAATLRLRRRLQFPGATLCSLAISHDGTRLALGGLNTVEVRTFESEGFANATE